MIVITVYECTTDKYLFMYTSKVVPNKGDYLTADKDWLIKKVIHHIDTSDEGKYVDSVSIEVE